MAASNTISEGIENLRLSDQVSGTEDISHKLGAVPRSGAGARRPEEEQQTRKQQKKKNRKDRRRSDVDSAGDSAASGPMSRLERLRAERRPEPAQSPASVPDTVTSLLFQSSSSISVNTGIKNLPDSFFSDRLPEELAAEAEEREKVEAKDPQKKRRRRKQKRKQTSTEEEDKQSEEKENIEQPDKLNEKLIDDDVGEEIVTNYGDEQCVVRQHLDKVTNVVVTMILCQYNWRNVTRNGDIKKCILVEGAREGGRPRDGDVVLVKSQGKLKDGAMIDDYPTLVFRY